MNENSVWAVVELMGHVTIAGMLFKPGEIGGLWQIDIPEGDSFRSEFFGSQSVYRVRVVSEDIARAYARPGRDIIAYDVPIITRDEHVAVVERARREISMMAGEIEMLRRRLVTVNALQSGTDGDEGGEDGKK